MRVALHAACSTVQCGHVLCAQQHAQFNKGTVVGLGQDPASNLPTATATTNLYVAAYTQQFYTPLGWHMASQPWVSDAAQSY